MNRFSRRKMLGALLMLPWLPVSAASNRSAATSARKTLVAYFSRSGNTRVIAGQIHRAPSDAVLFEIEPATPYPEDYEQTVEQARRERDRGYEPPLKSTVPNIAAYETIFLGFPVWGRNRAADHPLVSFPARPLGQDPGSVHHSRRLWLGPQPVGPRPTCAPRAAGRGPDDGGRPGAPHAEHSHTVAR
jgi:hypothetical protein